MAFRKFLSLRTHFRPVFCNRLHGDTRFSLLKYCSRSEPGLNCGSPTLRFGEVSDFSLPFWLRHPLAWPAAFQVMFKNNAESSLFELLRDVFSKNFQISLPFLCFSCSFPFTNAVSPVLSRFGCMACAVYKHFGRRSRTSFTTIFFAYKTFIAFSLRDRLLRTRYKKL